MALLSIGLIKAALWRKVIYPIQMFTQFTQKLQGFVLIFLSWLWMEKTQQTPAQINLQTFFITSGTVKAVAKRGFMLFTLTYFYLALLMTMHQ